MGRFNDHGDEFARADARERELERQMGMRDGVSSSAQYNPQRYDQQGFGQQGYNANPNYNYNSNYGYGQVPPSIWDGASQSRLMGAARSGIQRRMPPNPRAAKTAMTAMAVLFFFTAFIMLGVMLITAHNMRKDYRECTAQVEAEVVRNIRRSRGVNRGSSVYPVFRYEYGGKVYEQVSRTGSRDTKYDVGEKVVLNVDPDSPSRFYVDKEDTFVIVIISSIAAVFFVLGVVFAIGSAKKKKQIQSMLE